MAELNHLGIIIDGNRRYATKQGIGLGEAYKIGAQKVYDVVRYVFTNTSATQISIYALSQDNLSRTPEEVEAIMDVLKTAFDGWAADPFFVSSGIRVKFVGNVGKLPESLRGSCKALEEKTSKCNSKTLNMLVAYMGHREIGAAVEKAMKSAAAGGTNAIRSIESLISEHLEIKEPVDLVVRTANAHRLSGFLPWQSEYATLIAIDKLWPEIETGDVEQAIAEFKGGDAKHGL